MRALLSALYGLAAYLASQAALLYFIGFSSNLVVPRSVDIGPSAGWQEAVLTDVLLLAVFGVQHSVMARQGFKRWWTRVVPPVVERSTYLVATCAALVLMFRFWLPIDTPDGSTVPRSRTSVSSKAGPSPGCRHSPCSLA